MPRAAWQSRITGGLLALLVQAALIAGAILSLTRPAFLPRPHETILILRAKPQVEPRVIRIDARGPQPARVSPMSPIAPRQNQPSENPSSATAPDFRGFARSLFGCAPEHYAELSPEDRAHCPKPGKGLAREPDLAIPPRSHAKDEPYWQEQFRRARVSYGICSGGAVTTAQCLLEQDRAEHQREQEFDRQEADRKAAALQQPQHPPPRTGALGRRDQTIK